MTDQPKSLGEKNYEAFADRYVRIAETKGHNAYYDRPAVTSLLPDVNGLHVLDAGCGGGYYSDCFWRTARRTLRRWMSRRAWWNSPPNACKRRATPLTASQFTAPTCTNLSIFWAMHR
ncbi:MAG: hypothetical protein HC828_19575 [Blastochloris sp.]|nr:hypothetical protein [Blastochloris sp.]